MPDSDGWTAQMPYGYPDAPLAGHQVPPQYQEVIAPPEPEVVAPEAVEEAAPEATEETVDLEAMTKAELQAYADEYGIDGVDKESQNKADMIATIAAAE